MDTAKEKPHAVCLPYPAQGHINPMMKLAKLLHSRNFHITFVNTEYNHRRLLKSTGNSFLHALPDFHFVTIPDGLPQPSDDELDATQHIPTLCLSTKTTSSVPFQLLLSKLNDPSSLSPPVTCIVADIAMAFTLDADDRLPVPEVLLCTTSACGLLGYYYYKELVRRGLVPLQDVSSLCDREFMERKVEGIPGMEGMRFKDYPTFIRTADPNDVMLNFELSKVERSSKASAIVINTFDELERPVLDVIKKVLDPPIYTLGPLSIHCEERSVGTSLWTEDVSCLEWLRGRPEASVVYVNFGSIAVATNQQLAEFAWGPAGSGYDFLWVIRPDMAGGRSEVLLPEGFAEATEGRGIVVSWCPQEEVLGNSAVGGFLTHCGWNSTLEGVCGGIAMACWPFFAEQQTNCWFMCNKWGIGVEIGGDVRREEVEGLIRELMGGEKGKKMRGEVLKWKEKGRKAVTSANGERGTSFRNLEKLIDEVLLPPTK